MTLEEMIAEIHKRPGFRLNNLFEHKGRDGRPPEWQANLCDDDRSYFYRTGTTAGEALALAIADLPPVAEEVDPFA